MNLGDLNIFVIVIEGEILGYKGRVVTNLELFENLNLVGKRGVKWWPNLDCY